MDPSQQTTNDTQPVVIGSTNKKGFSRKQKVFGGLAAFIALVGIGFGGLSIWQGLTSNAADEATLGNDAAIAIPPESPYFKITAYDQQNVKLAAQGEAARLNDTTPTPLLAEGWRIERSTNPTDAASWEVALDSSVNAFTAESNTTNQPAGAYDRKSVVLDPTQPQCEYCADASIYGRIDRDNGPNLNNLQPETSYYYRAAKNITDETGASSWQPQGPEIKVSTLAYPKVVKAAPIAGDSNHVTIAWTDSNPSDQGLRSETYGTYAILATKTAAEGMSSGFDPTYFQRINVLPHSYLTPIENSGGELLKGGEVTVPQPEGTTYYYTLVKLAVGVTTRVATISTPVAVTTAAQTSDNMVSAKYFWPTGSPAKLTWVENHAKKANISITQNMVGQVKLWRVDVYNANRNNYLCGSTSIPANTDPTFVVSAYCPTNWETGVVKPIVKVYAETTSKRQVVQELRMPDLTITKVATPLTASYAKNPVDANNRTHRASATIKLRSGATPSSVCVQGTVRVKNLATGSIIGSKAVTVCPGSTYNSITVSNLKPGKVRLAVLYTSGATGLFVDKTITLTTLTVTR